MRQGWRVLSRTGVDRSSSLWGGPVTVRDWTVRVIRVPGWDHSRQSTFTEVERGAVLLGGFGTSGLSMDYDTPGASPLLHVLGLYPPIDLLGPPEI